MTRLSSYSSDRKSFLSTNHHGPLRDYPGRIHGKFARLYVTTPDAETFAMEAGLKIAHRDVLASKPVAGFIRSTPYPIINLSERT
jgi:hypothetical protein